MPQTIYCDESGFTGPHLSDEKQPYFAYASVAVSPERADEIVSKAVADFHLQSSELKGRKLVKSGTGRKVLSFLLRQCLKESQTIVVNKKYALACKLFEYIFEPALSDKSSIFYGLDFHRFVSTLLFVELQTRSASAEKLLKRFEHLMRVRGPEGLASFFEQHAPKRRTRSIAREVVAFCHAQRKAIVEELSVIDKLGAVGRWVLDVTDAALYSLLCYWGGKYDQLEVSCDESKPLFAHIQENSVFTAMIGRMDKQYFDFGRGKTLLTFNLSRQIALLNSKKSRGIQIADAIAAALSNAIQNPKDRAAKEWLAAFDAASAVHPDSIIPDLTVIDVRRPEAALNKLLFNELVRRCRKGENILDGIEDFVRFPYRRR